MNAAQPGNFAPVIFGDFDGGITTYIQVIVGGDGQSPCSTVLIGDGRFSRLPYVPNNWGNSPTTTPLIPVFKYADSSRTEIEQKDISRGFDFHVRSNASPT